MERVVDFTDVTADPERVRIGAFNAEQYARFKAACYFMCIPTRGPTPWVDPIPYGSRDGNE